MALTRPRAAQIYDIDYKQATRVVTVTNVTLSGGAPSQVDGVNLSLKDRVLVTGQNTGAENGIYYVTTLGTGSNGTWTRSLDTDATGELLAGTVVMVTEGLIYADTQWKLTTNDPIVIGTTALTFVQNYSANSISSGTSNVTVLTNSSVLISSAGSANVLKIDSGLITVGGNIIPSSNVTYSLGNTTNRFANLWLSNTTIYLGNVTIGATATTLTINGSNVVTAGANSDVQTTGNISATGNVTAGNILTTGVVSTSGNVYGANLIVSNIESVTGNITGGNLLTAGVVSATANVTGGNVLTAGVVSATANVTGGNVLTSGLVSATGNVTGGNVLTAGVVSATGNATAGNINTAGEVSATGNITTAGYVLGNVFYANGITASKIYSGTSEVNVVSSGGNVNVTIGGTSNVAVYATTGQYITGVMSATANVTGGNLLTAGLVSATGNITTAGYFLGNVACASGIYASRIFNGTTEANIGTANGNVNVSVGGTSNVVVFATTGEYVTGVVSVSGNIIGANLLTVGLISSTGNATAGNLLTTGLISATGNATAGNLLTTGLISATGTVTSVANITGGNLLTTGLISATGVLYSGNIYTSGGLSLTGNTITSSGATLTIDPNGSGAVDGNVVIAGNLSVQGNVTYIDSNVITTNEKSITLANNVSTGALADGAGIDVGNTTIAYWRFNNATTSWQSNIGLTPAANATLNLGGTSNYWATLYSTAASVSGNTTSGNLLTGGLISATSNIAGGNLLTVGLISSTGNATAGNVLTAGVISATGNITGNYINANGAALTGVNTFSNIAVTGGAFIAANTISTLLTLVAGNNIVLTANNTSKSLQIDYSSSGGTSIFSTGGDMGLVTEAVSSSEDLGSVTTASTTSYDLGTLGVQGVVSNSDIIGNTITGDKINSSTYISITGNLTAANLAMTSSKTDIRGLWLGTGNSFSASSQMSTATDVILSSTGLKAYVLASAGSVYQYSMSTAYSASTASYDNLSFSFTSQDTNPQSIARNGADTAAWMLGGKNATVYQYSFGATGNIASLSYDSLSFSVASQEPTPTGFTFNSDYSYMYVVGTTNKTVYQYQLTSAGNIATAVYSVPGSYSVASQVTSPSGISFNDDGTVMYISDSSTQNIYQYTLTSANNVTTGVTYNNSFNVASQERIPNGLTVNTTKGYIYLTGSFTNNVFQYNIGNSTVMTANATYQTGNLTVGNINVTGNLLQNGNLYATQVQAMMYALAF